MMKAALVLAGVGALAAMEIVAARTTSAVNEPLVTEHPSAPSIQTTP
jgi:hypothetical protein